MTVQDIFNFLNAKFPTATACDFDNVGLLVGDKDKTVSKALIVLDCTMIAIEEAINSGCELIISHHPVIFNPLKRILKGDIVFEAIKNNISIISMHTNLDQGSNGVNDILCDILEPTQKGTFVGYDNFIFRKCTISPISSDDLADKLKLKLGGSIKYVPSNKMIENVLVCGGSGGNFIIDAQNFGFDALITADVKHNHFLDAQHNGIALFDAGHFNTENVVIEPLKELLQNKFPQIKFKTNHISLIKSR